ncbi:MAG: adaptor protein MecA [Ruminiclostridium sp.]
MKIDVLSNSTVKITLSGGDMKEYDLRYENLSRKSPDTKRLLGEVLKAVSLESDIFFDANADRLFIEAFPRSDGGCMLYISSLEEEEKPSKPKRSKAAEKVCPLLICFVDGVESLGGLCRNLCSLKGREGICFSSSVYSEGGSYWLTVEAECDTARLEAVMREYGNVYSDRLAAAALAEHCSEIACGNGAEIIANSIG